MQDEILFSITRVTDDSTGIWQVNELEFNIHSAFDDYIKTNGLKGVNSLMTMLGHMAWEVKDKFYKYSKPEGGVIKI